MSWMVSCRQIMPEKMLQQVLALGDPFTTPKGDFYLISRNYTPQSGISEALNPRAVFAGPPGVLPAPKTNQPSNEGKP